MRDLESAEDRALLTFNGPVKIHPKRTPEGLREYVITPLSDAALLEALCAARVREAWYAGVDAALREAEKLSLTEHPLPLGRLRAQLVALRHPKDNRHE